MKKETGTRLAKAAGLCLALLLILFSAAVSVYAIAGNGELLASEMLRCAPPEVTGLPAAEYAGVCRMTADYLTDRAAAFQYPYSDEKGNTFSCFQPHEAAHMADCRGLIRLAGTLRWVCGGAALALLAAGVLLKQYRRAMAEGAIPGLRIAGVLGAGLLIWGLIDFDSLFIAFHRLAFDNDGWLLDDRTDLLIRLMPTDFFISLALRWLAAMLAGAALTRIAAQLCRGKEHEA